MAHFAKLNSNNIVEQVIVVSNDDITDINGNEIESIGIAFCQKIMGAETNWKQTSYNDTIRGNYAGIGMTYMENVATLGVGSTDIFISPEPEFASWGIGVTFARWESPHGDAPGLTSTQRGENKYYVWLEDGYQADNSVGWALTTP